MSRRCASSIRPNSRRTSKFRLQHQHGQRAQSTFLGFRLASAAARAAVAPVHHVRMFHTNHVHQHAWRSTQHACPGGKVAWSGQAVASRPRIAACSATSAPPTASADDTSDSEPRKIRRTRLFRSESSEPKQPASAAVAQPAETERSKRSAPEPPAVSDEFRKAFESLGIQTLPVRQAPTRQVSRSLDGWCSVPCAA